MEVQNLETTSEGVYCEIREKGSDFHVPYPPTKRGLRFFTVFLTEGTGNDNKFFVIINTDSSVVL